MSNNVSRKNAIVCHNGLGDFIMNAPLIQNYLSETQEQTVLIVKSGVERKWTEYVCSLALKSNKNLVVWECGVGYKRWINMLYYAFKLHLMNIDILMAPTFHDKLINMLWIKAVNAKLAVGLGRKYNSKSLNITIAPSLIIHKSVAALKIYDRLNGLNHVYNEKMLCLPVESSYVEEFGESFFNEDIICFGPGSGILEVWKRWPEEHYIELGKLIINKYPGLKICILGNGHEKQVLLNICKGISDNKCFLFADLSFGALRYLLSRSYCVVCACAGISHIASTVANLKIIGLYGPTNQAVTAPLTSNLIAITTNMPCAPCYGHGIVCTEKYACMSKITPIRVFESICSIVQNEKV